MAHIHEENIIITVSKLVKGNETTAQTVSPDVLSALEAVVSELVGDPSVVVEVVSAPNSQD